MNIDSLIKTISAGLILAVALAGCASLEKSDAMDTERVLAAAGFKMKFANTAAQKEQVKKLPQRKITHMKRDGKLVFVYADSQYCKCMYVGTQSEYQQFEKLTIQKNIAMEQSIAAEDADMAWGEWGAWD